MPGHVGGHDDETANLCAGHDLLGPHGRAHVPDRWHANYAGAVLQSLSSGLVFASWPSIPPLLVHVALLVYRTLHEEKVLPAELPGYDEYAVLVRYRFVPGLW
jgi:hypothetical protein